MRGKDRTPEENRGGRKRRRLIPCSSQDEPGKGEESSVKEGHYLGEKTEEERERNKCLHIWCMVPSALSRSPSLLHHGPLGRASKSGVDKGEEGDREIMEEMLQGEIGEGGGGGKKEEEDSEMSGESFKK